MTFSKIEELDRQAMLDLLMQDREQLPARLKPAFWRQLDYLARAAGHYYHSQAPLAVKLIRPFLIAVIDEEADVKTRLGGEFDQLNQAVHDLAFGRALMVILKSSVQQLNQQERKELLSTSQLALFREKLNHQEAWQALLAVMASAKDKLVLKNKNGKITKRLTTKTPCTQRFTK